MAIFRDLKGRFFAIPDGELEKYRISASDLANSRKDFDGRSCVPGESGDAPTIVVNQFFAPVDPAGVQGGCNDFAAQYTYPAAWGGQR